MAKRNLKEISFRIGSEMLRPITSSETKKIGATLVLVSFLALLLVLNFIELKLGAVVFDLFTVKTTSKIIYAIIGLICFYYGLIYRFSISADFKKWKYENKEIRLNQDRIVEAILKLNSGDFAKPLGEFDKNERLKAKQKITLKLAEDDIKAMQDKMDKLFDENNFAESQKVEDELSQRWISYNQYCSDLDAKVQSDLENIFKTLKDRQIELEPIQTVLSDTSQYYKASYLWERIFPLSLAGISVLAILVRIIFYVN